jgi:glycine cleavage system H protein
MGQLRYTKEHEWVRMEGDVAVCGISDYAQKSLGDIVYVELPSAGKKVKKGDETAVVESAKAASEVYAPIDGEVTAVNDNLSSQPGAVNSAPTGSGWFFKLKPADTKQWESLMDEAAYKKYVDELTG